MKRAHWFEFGDQPWLPQIFRRGFTQYLAAVARWTKLYRPTAACINELLVKTGEKKIVALGAGSGGGILDVLPELPSNVEVVLTDILPDKDLRLPDPRVKYYPEPADARRVPDDFKGVRVMYAAFHHFRPTDAREIFQSAVAGNQPIAIIEGTERSLPALLSMILVVPFAILLVMPFIRPFSFWRIFWTLVIPVFPILGAWDGFVSCLRTYSDKDYTGLVDGLDSFEWRYRVLKSPSGAPISVFSGAPK